MKDERMEELIRSNTGMGIEEFLEHLETEARKPRKYDWGSHSKAWWDEMDKFIKDAVEAGGFAYGSFTVTESEPKIEYPWNQEN